MTPSGDVTPGLSAVEASGRRRWIGLAVLAAGLSMIVLDGTIVGVALPVLIRDLGPLVE